MWSTQVPPPPPLPLATPLLPLSLLCRCSLPTVSDPTDDKLGAWGKFHQIRSANSCWGLTRVCLLHSTERSQVVEGMGIIFCSPMLVSTLRQNFGSFFTV